MGITKKPSTDFIKLTKIATIVMAILCIVADILGCFICSWTWNSMFLLQPGLLTGTAGFALLISIYYLCSVFAYGILFNFYRLLDNLNHDIVFVRENTKLMKYVTISCFSIFALCVIGMVIWPSLVFIGIIGLFMGLIVQCVRVVIDKAIDMREELDYTV